MKKVSDVMTPNVRAMSPTDSVERAAKTMEELDVGVVPVCNGQKLVGMVTDRDIVLRAVAKGRAASDTSLVDVMSAEVKWCYDDQALDEVLGEMSENQIRRLPVVDRAHKLVGMITLGDIATKAEEPELGESLAAISEPSHPVHLGA